MEDTSDLDLAWIPNMDPDNFLRIYDVLLDVANELNIRVEPEKNGAKHVRIPLFQAQIKFRRLFPGPDSAGLRVEYTQGRLKALAFLKDKQIVREYFDPRGPNSWMNDWMDMIDVFAYESTTKQALSVMQLELKQRVSEAKKNSEPAPAEPTKSSNSMPNLVFIGHGRSLLWMQLKEFLSERLHLPVDEFNRESAAGLSTKERLHAMLTSANFAFLVMTAEDEDSSGDFHARENVIHEAGLFQAKLGFERAIILLEDGCKEFANIHGLTSIRFPKANVKATFEEVRRVLEREGLLPAVRMDRSVGQ